MRKTKILTTLGPASDPVLEKILELANGVRINFSHGDWRERKERIRRVREYVEETGKMVTIVGDTAGPEVRTGRDISVEEGEAYDFDEFGFSPGGALERTVEEGDTVLMDDGRFVFLVRGGKLVSLGSGEMEKGRGVIVRGKDFPLPAISEKDREDLEMAKKMCDMIALSFVKSARDVYEAKKISDLPVIAKIESVSGVKRLKEIVRASEGVMVARGDLALVLGPEKVPKIQERVINLAREERKLSVVATQVLESMREHPFPTRAEVTDVYNAVRQGADVVMLSGETAKGKYPVKAVETLDSLIQEAEASVGRKRVEPQDYKDRVALAAISLAEDQGVPLVAPTMHGTTPRKLSTQRPSVPIYALSPNSRVLKILNMHYGIVPVEMEYEPFFDKIGEIKEKLGIKRAVFVFGYPPGNRNTNVIYYG